MCGRFSAEIDIEELEKYATLDEEVIAAEKGFDSRPGTSQIVVAGGRACLMNWGWTRDWSKRLLINARFETAGDKKTWKGALEGRRCAIPALGWWEWTGEKGRKTPFFHRTADSAMIFLAGVFERSGEGSNFVIMTRSSFGPMAEIHDRMPLVLGADSIGAWLDRDVPLAGVSRFVDDALSMQWDLIECDRLGPMKK
jgi:putative SOS response-associated peptidase YedK